MCHDSINENVLYAVEILGCLNKMLCSFTWLSHGRASIVVQSMDAGARLPSLVSQQFNLGQVTSPVCASMPPGANGQVIILILKVVKKNKPVSIHRAVKLPPGPEGALCVCYYYEYTYDRSRQGYND